MQIRSVIIFLIGGAIIAAAFFAEAIGLDNDPGWGKGRIAILVFGIFIVACGIFYSLYTETALSIVQCFQFSISQTLRGLFAFIQRYWYTFPLLILVIVVYVWFASSGAWTDWHSATNYYANLALGFKEGNLHLPIEPNSRLLSLANPYDPVAREGVNFPVDYSLYNGKFYLYWGPVPALILLFIDPFTRGRVGDLYLVFSFVCATFLLQSLLIVITWDRFFRDLPKWILGLSILVVGLMTPWTYILINEPNGRIYEAAISGAQFFLMGGFLVATIAFYKPIPSTFLLLFVGALWGLAIGTRLVIVVPTACMMVVIAYWILKARQLPLIHRGTKLIALFFPVLLCLICLGWYNWSRFGSVTETGFSYALAGVNLSQNNDLFSPTYIFQNLHTYLFQPSARMAHFPFLYPREISPVTGLLFAAPFTLFALLPILTVITKVISKFFTKTVKKDDGYDVLDWIRTSLAGSFLSAFFLILMFFWIATRYTGDFMPALALLSVLGFWQGYQHLAPRPRSGRLYSILGIILATVSIVINILLSISVKQLGRTGF